MVSFPALFLCVCERKGDKKEGEVNGLTVGRICVTKRNHHSITYGNIDKLAMGASTAATENRSYQRSTPLKDRGRSERLPAKLIRMLMNNFDSTAARFTVEQ